MSVSRRFWMLVLVMLVVAGGLIATGAATQSGVMTATGSDIATNDESDIDENDIKESSKKMYLRVYGSTTPGETLTVVATDSNGSPLTNAEVVMNGEEVNSTDMNGHAEITVPEDELDLEVYADGAHSEVNIDVQQDAATTVGESKIDIIVKDDGSESTISTSTTTSQSTSISQSTTTSQSTNISQSTTIFESIEKDK